MLVLLVDLKIKPHDVLFERPEILARHAAVAIACQPIHKVLSAGYFQSMDSLVMLIAGLVRIQGLPVLVEAQQRVVEALAALDGVGDGGTADDEALVHDAGEVLERLDLAEEGLADGLGHVRPELEQYCGKGKGGEHIVVSRSREHHGAVWAVWTSASRACGQGMGMEEVPMWTTVMVTD
jgi:hypothetical protein